MFISKDCENNLYKDYAINGIITNQTDSNVAPYRKELMMTIKMKDTTMIIANWQENGFEWHIGDSVIKNKGSLIFHFKSKKDGEWHVESWDCKNDFGY